MEKNKHQQEKAQIELINKKELVGSDINLERLPELFTTRFYPYKSREITRKENGKETKIIIGKRPNGEELGILDATDGKIFYSLLKLWEEQGYPDSGYVIFKTCEFLRKMGKKADSKQAYKWFETHLSNLSTVLIRWIESYERNGVKSTKGFTLIDYYELFERKKDNPNKPYFDLSEVRINREIIETIKTKNVKFVRYDVIRELRSDIAFILYRWLDRTLYPVEKEYERDLGEVAKICGIERQPLKEIKRRIQKAIKELEGKELTHGVIKNIRIEKRKEEKESGWKLVVEIEKSPDKKTLQKREIIDLELPGMPQVSLEDQQAWELVLYLHEKLGHVDSEGKIEVPDPPAETSRAATLIKRYGYDWTKEFVNYIIESGRGKTAHVFGYVYTFLDEFKKYKAEEERRKREKEEQQYRKSQLSKLPEMIYQKLYEEIKSRLLLKYKGDTYMLASLEGRTHPDAGQKAIEEEMIKVIKTFPVVTLKYVDSKAQDVKYAGDWTNWQAKPMDRKENGMWYKEIRLPAGVYKYKFIVDGVWIPDPNGESANDGFGNSVLKY